MLLNNIRFTGGERSILLSYRDIYSIKNGNNHFSS